VLGEHFGKVVASQLHAHGSIKALDCLSMEARI
jgi:hypothetical protein